MPLQHKTVGTAMSQTEYEAADGHAGQPLPTILVIASNAKNVGEYSQVAGKLYVCDGTADDVQLNAAIAALPSSIGRIVLSEGQFNISAPVLLPSNTSIEGMGIGVTVLKLADNVMPGAGAHGGRLLSHTNYNNASSTDRNITIRNLTIDGNKANNADVGGGGGGGISFAYATGIYIDAVEVKDVDAIAGVYLAGVTGATNETNLAVRITNCIIRDCTTTTGVGSYGAMLFITASQTISTLIRGNYGVDNLTGILIEDSPVFGLIAENEIKLSSLSSSGTALILNGTGARGFTVANNIIRRYGRGMTVEANGSAFHAILGNIIDACHHDGILVGTPGSTTDVPTNVLVAANNIRNTQAGPGIRIGSASTNVSVIGNRCSDDQGTKTQTYGLVLAAETADCHVVGNDFRNNLTDLISPAGTGHIFENNVGYNTGTAAPTSGTWQRGTRVYNTTPSAAGYAGWVCVTAGTPGTWKGFGAIEA